MITTVVMCNIMLLGESGADAVCRTPKSARIIEKYKHLNGYENKPDLFIQSSYLPYCS